MSDDNSGPDYLPTMTEMNARKSKKKVVKDESKLSEQVSTQCKFTLYLFDLLLDVHNLMICLLS